MIRALYTAASGMIAQQMNLDNISNNLANVNTTGFKKIRIDFVDLLYQTEKSPGSPVAQGLQNPTGLQIGLGVEPAATQRIFTQGDFERSDNPLDMVIEGNGFFQLTLPDGTIAYTRDGTFRRDSNGRIVNIMGYPLEPQITIPQDAIEINIGQDGTVSVITQGNPQPQTLGQITVANFVNPSGLSSIGKNMFIETGASGPPIVGTPGTNGLGNINQGYIENSNVQVVEEMVKMIVSQRAYEVNSKAIQTSDNMLQIAANLRR